MTNPLEIDALVINVEMKDAIRNQIGTKEVTLNLRMVEKIGEA